MPHFNFTCKSDNSDSFIEDLLRRKSQVHVDTTSTTVEEGNNSSTSSFTDNNKGENSYLATLKTNYEKLPDYIKYCFDYCCIISMYSIEKGKLVRLLLAEGLIPEKTGYIMEDIAANIITELIGLGMFQLVVDDAENEQLEVASLYRQFSLIKSNNQDFVAKAANSPLRVVMVDDGKDINPKLKSLVIRSLFVRTAEHCSASFGSSRGFSRASMEIVCGLQFLLVLDLESQIEYLPNELGDLVQLRYLGLVNSELSELPKTLGNLQKLQTLDISKCWKLHELPIQVINIQQLRHLIMFSSIRVPKGIGRLANLHTCTGVYAGGGIASELSTLTQLQELSVECVSEDHASELSAAIMKMENLISLSLKAKETYSEDGMFSLFPDEFEPFSPPPLLQELYLHGHLVEMPIWFASLSNLTRLILFDAHLPETPTSVLQFLPKLKHLNLQEAYEAKHIGKEFCQAGGFPELETLIISSNFLVDWSEIVDGAFPRLRVLSICCFELRFLPEGLQNISTLEELSLHSLHGDLARRLKNRENYKLKHISKLSASF